MLLLAALAVAPAAWAGTELAPDVDDHPDQADPRLDLLAAWFEDEPGGVRFTVKVGAIEENATDIFYLVSFDMVGASRLAAVTVDAEGEVLTYLGPQGPGRNGEPPEGIANGALDRPSIRAGSPGYATAILPLEPGTALGNLSAGVSEYQRERGRWADVDFRATENTHVVARTLVPSTVGANVWIILAIAGVFALGAAGGAWIGVRRGRRGADAITRVEVKEEGGAQPRFTLKPK